MLAWIADHDVTLMGVIFLLVLGPAVGNYACSVVYRLPRGQTPFERHPFCGHCNADLQPRDLFPILSWLQTRGKCRYCGGAVPGLYTVIELACGLSFIAYFLTFGFSEPFLIYAALATFVIMLAAIEWQQGWISVTLYSYAMALVLLVRTLQEATIFGAVQGAVVMLVLALLVWRASPGRSQPPFEKPWIWWLVLLAALVPMAHWVVIVGLIPLILITPKRYRVALYAAAMLAVPVAMKYI
jgi:prepilin signal peptidase PulO-like enzyme (type II secretory pathway)